MKEKINNVRITIRDSKDYEAGLMLLVLKDLWTGDLAVGGEKNIGRGVLEGFSADIIWDDESIHLEKDITKISDEDKGKLASLVKALSDYQGGVTK